MWFNLLQGTFWLIAGVALLVGHFSSQASANMKSERTLYLGMCALALAAYKFARCWALRVAAQAPASQPPPPRRLPIEQRPAEYNPALDFTRDEPPAQ